METSNPVEDWLRVHRTLLEMETAFTDLALRAAAGEVWLEKLDEERDALMAFRELCAAVYGKAFPKPAGARSGSGASSVVPYMNQGEQEKASGNSAPGGSADEGIGGGSDTAG